MKDSETGLYQKYKVTRIYDPNGKHMSCAFFVLDLNHDKFSIPALKAYAEACAIEFPWLYSDLLTLIERIPKEDGREYEVASKVWDWVIVNAAGNYLPDLELGFTELGIKNRVMAIGACSYRKIEGSGREVEVEK